MVSASEQERKLWEQIHRDLSKAQTDAERVRIISEADDQCPGIREFFECLAGVLVSTGVRVKAAQQIVDLLGNKNAGRDDFAELAPMDGLTVLTLCTLLDITHLERAKKLNRSKGGTAAGALLKQSAMEKGQEVRKIAESLLRNGVIRRELAGKISERLRITPNNVREHFRNFPPRGKRI